MKNHHLWCEKYRPKTLDEYVFHNPHHKQKVLEWIDNGSIPHILMSGVQGSGKTTLAKILIDSLNVDEMDVLELNASDENSVDVMREKIKSFVTTAPMGPFKIVHLEEADYLTLSGQSVMRGLAEEYEQTARFVMTCNYVHKIMPAIRSRFQEILFKSPDINDITEYCATVLVKEQIDFDLETLDKYIAVGFPDVRKIINTLQLQTVGGKLLPPTFNGAQAGDWKFKLLDLIEADQWAESRKLVCGNVVADEWEDLYRFLYENIDKCPKFKVSAKWEQAIVTIAEYLYKHQAVADPEVNAAACFITLGQI